ncbi:hypothetical protein N7467_001934 [Penicillium canescens]|nr:hypothetical protein N7467_001934 [Penicillium canescens]
MELEHTEGATTVGLSSGPTREQYIHTEFGNESISPKGDLKTDARPLLQDVLSKITFSPVSLDRNRHQTLASSDALHADSSSESDRAPTDH